MCQNTESPCVRTSLENNNPDRYTIIPLLAFIYIIVLLHICIYIINIHIYFNHLNTLYIQYLIYIYIYI